MTWEEIWEKVNNPTSLKRLQAWSVLCSFDKCFMCSTKMNLIIPMPKDVTTPLANRLNPSYLFHVESTHGLDHETVANWLIDYINKV